jgi:thioredoxin reductase (NADPH)
MSDYLIEQLRSTRNVTIRYRGAVVGGLAIDDCLSGVEVQDLDDGTSTVVPAAGLFVLIGSNPHSGWLEGTLQRDGAGYVRTGVEVERSDRSDPARTPLPLETSMSGVFAIGDTRLGSVKRVATAVGDGASVVAQVHGYLAEVSTGVAAP